MDRLSLDSDLILLDAGAMLAYAPYRARVLLTGDPFASAEGLAQLLEVDANAIRIRLHDALLSAEKIVTIAGSAYDAIAPLISRKPDDRDIPAHPIAGGGDGPIGHLWSSTMTTKAHGRTSCRC